MMRVSTLCMFSAPTFANGMKVHIENHCDKELTITGTDGQPILGTLQPGESLTETPSGSSGRYQAYWSMSDIGAKYGLFEYTVCGGGSRLCCNPSHVDVFTMPITLTCAADNRRTGCTKNPSMAEVRAALQKCPTAHSEFGSVSDSKFCYSAGYACAVHPDAERCGYDPNAPMQRAMKRFGGGPDSAKHVYQCAGSNFATHSTACAKLHRGVDNPGADPSTYYQLYEDGVPVFNEYSKWVHDLCGPNDYAFPYDDNGKHGGYQECEGDITVTFCSQGGPSPPPPPPSPHPLSCDAEWGSCQPEPGSGSCRDHLNYAISKEGKTCSDALNELSTQCSVCSGCRVSDCSHTPTPPPPSPGPWSPCTHGHCCNPYSSIKEYCPGGLACQECGGGDACQCPSQAGLVV